MKEKIYTDYTVGGNYVPQKVSRAAKPLGIISLVCGILSLGLFFVPWYSLPIAVIGIVLGAISHAKNRANKLYKTALILSIIGAALAVVIMIVYIGLCIIGTSNPIEDYAGGIYDFGSGFSV